MKFPERSSRYVVDAFFAMPPLVIRFWQTYLVQAFLFLRSTIGMQCSI